MANAGYQWMTMDPIPPGGSTATGSIVGGTGFNDVSVSITHTGGGMSDHPGAVGSGEFPLTIGGVDVNIPTTANQIKNVQAGTFTAVFNKPVANVLVAFGSVGQSGLVVPVTVSQPFTPLWTKAGYTVYLDPVGATQYNQFTGEEGYNLIQIDGTMTEISFIYGASENYCTMSFGFVDQNDPEVQALFCDPLYDKFAYGNETGCERFRRLWVLGYV
jgi:hypothetical protein